MEPCVQTKGLDTTYQGKDSAQGKVFRVLYLFAGEHRKSSIGSFLQARCKAEGIPLRLKEVDLLRGKEQHNLALDEIWEPIGASIEAGEWDVIVATPPCNTHSRAPWANNDGPKPLRSRQYPTGFPWLEGAKRAKCELANLLVERSVGGALAGSRSPAKTLWLLEHPEDLGCTKDGGNPASMWQLDITQHLVKETGATQGALLQCRFTGKAGTRKPTRLAGTLKGLDSILYVGAPVFDKRGKYKGPLPPHCGHFHNTPLIGRKTKGIGFKTGDRAAYPKAMCQALADIIFNNLRDTRHRRVGTSAVPRNLCLPLGEGTHSGGPRRRFHWLRGDTDRCHLVAGHGFVMAPLLYSFLWSRRLPSPPGGCWSAPPFVGDVVSPLLQEVAGVRPLLMEPRVHGFLLHPGRLDPWHCHGIRGPRVGTQ